MIRLSAADEAWQEAAIAADELREDQLRREYDDQSLAERNDRDNQRDRERLDESPVGSDAP